MIGIRLLAWCITWLSKPIAASTLQNGLTIICPCRTIWDWEAIWLNWHYDGGIFSCKGFVRVGCIKEETGNPIYWKHLWNPHNHQLFSGFHALPVWQAFLVVCYFLLLYALKLLLIDKIMCRDGRPHCSTLLGACEERGLYCYVEETFK